MSSSLIFGATATRLGSELYPADRAHVLNSYTHRYTGDHKPAWARQARPCGSAYPVQFASDADWLANTHFAVTRAGALDLRFRECYSSPTWPNNPELRTAA